MQKMYTIVCLKWVVPKSLGQQQIISVHNRNQNIKQNCTLSLTLQYLKYIREIKLR